MSSPRAASAIEPHTNVLRSTASGFAAVLGGADQVMLAPFDEPLGSPSEHAARLARNTQLILRVEAHLGWVLDPAGGSYYVEALTDRLARKGWQSFQEVDHLGGVERGLRDGSILDRVRGGAEKRAEAVASRRRVRVGVNRYPAAEDPEPRSAESPPQPLRKGDAGPEAVRRLAGGGALGELARVLAEEGARSSIAALNAALGHGDEPDAVEPLPAFHEAAAYESLRARAAGLSGSARRAVVLAVGDARRLKARADFGHEALSVAGLRVTESRAWPDVDRALDELDDVMTGQVLTVALATADEDYEEVATRLAGALRERGARTVIALTSPEEREEALRGAGIDRFLHRGMDAVAELSAVLEALEESP